MKNSFVLSSFFTLPALVGLSITSAHAEEVDKEHLMTIGKQNYVTCLACHGVDGKGMQAGPLKMAPSLEGSELLLADPEVSVSIILRGIQKEDAKYAGMMAPLGAALDDEKLAGVLTYVRNAFGNSGDPITPGQVKEIREKYKDKLTQPWKRAELDALLAEKKGGGDAAEAGDGGEAPAAE